MEKTMLQKEMMRLKKRMPAKRMTLVRRMKEKTAMKTRVMVRKMRMSESTLHDDKRTRTVQEIKF